MQRNICRILGACGLAITFSAAGQTAGTAAAGGATAGAATTTTQTVAPPASGPRIATGKTAATSPAGAPGQSVTGAAGQSVTATPPQTITPASPAAPLPGQNTSAGAAGAAVGTANNTGAIATPIAFATLPANLQAQIASQIPAGAQVSQIIQETSPQGAVTYRAQLSQNGAMREIALSPATAAQLSTRPGTLTPAGTSGLLVGAPVAFGAVPTAVQGALTTAAAGAPLSNLTFTPGLNGAGLYRGLVNGRPVEVRVGPNGQILPSTTQLAATASTVSTNDLKFDDLPLAVRDAIKSSRPDAEVARIRRVDGTSGDLFDVTLRGDGQESKLRLSENGTVVEETREQPVSIANTTPVATNEPPKLVFNTLPEAVRNAISTRTDQKSIRAMFLTNHNAKTTFAVDYVDMEALRHRLFIAKDGMVVSAVTNLFGIKPTGQVVVVADLPAPARAAIERQASGQVMRVNTATREGAPVYVVSYLKDGEMQQMIVSETGERIDAVGAPASAEIGQENK